jgi:hypothetical protein
MSKKPTTKKKVSRKSTKQQPFDLSTCSVIYTLEGFFNRKWVQFDRTYTSKKEAVSVKDRLGKLYDNRFRMFKITTKVKNKLYRTLEISNE